MMRKFYIAVALLSGVWGYAVADSQSELLGRAKSLLEHGRYADARHEYLRLKQVAPADDLGLIQQAEYGLTVCAVELDDNVAEQRMIGFLNRYPGSVHAADIRFVLHCTTARLSSGRAQNASLRL